MLGAMFAMLIPSMLHANGEGEIQLTDVNTERIGKREAMFYELAYDVVTNKNGEYTQLSAVVQTYENFLADVAADFSPDSLEFFYFDALGRREISNTIAAEDTEGAQVYFYAAIQSAEKAVELTPAYPDVYALLASLQANVSRYEGGLAILGYLASIERLNQQAFTLDENNALAWENLGAGYLFSPPAFGRDISKAIEAFEKQETYGNPYQQFWGRVWLSAALFAQEDFEGSQAIIAKLMQEAPRSPLVQLVAREIRNGKNPFSN